MNTERIIEAILFASSNRMSTKDLALMSECSIEEVSLALQNLKKKYQESDTSITIQQDEEHFKFSLKSEYMYLAEKLMPSTELPKPVVETLAMIAWKSPIMQADLVKLRSPAVYDHIIELEKLQLITRQKKGRTFALKITDKFHEYFDIPKEKYEETFGKYIDVSEEEETDKNQIIETEEEKQTRILEEIRNNKIDPLAIIASDKAFLDDFDKRLGLVQNTSSDIDNQIKESDTELEDLNTLITKKEDEEDVFEENPENSEEIAEINEETDPLLEEVQEEKNDELEVPEFREENKKEV